jgi:hypothetical protein
LAVVVVVVKTPINVGHVAGVVIERSLTREQCSAGGDPVSEPKSLVSNEPSVDVHRDLEKSLLRFDNMSLEDGLLI